jgi:TolA-binding protein
MSLPDLFRKAVKLAKNGHRVEARNLLLELVDGNPDHELAWIWLSQLVDDPEDRIIALENALTINPDRPETAVRLETLRQQKQAREFGQADLFQQAKQLYRDGRKAEARQRLQKLVSQEPKHSKAWLGLALLEPKLEDQIFALETTLRLNPDQPKASRKLDQLKQSDQIDYLVLGKKFEENGRPQKAIAAYKKVEKGTYSNTDKAIAKKHRLYLESTLKEKKPLKFTNPTTNLIRLALGPILVYAMLVFIQSGLNPLHISPLLLLGGMMVPMGSLLLVGTANTPHHHWWKRLLGPEGLAEIKKRKMMALLGLVLIMLPFTLVFLVAFYRLAAYEAAFTFNIN